MPFQMEREDVVLTSFKENGKRSRRLQRKHCPPEIDRFLQMKWGLNLLGEEKSKEYLEWLRIKLSRNP